MTENAALQQHMDELGLTQGELVRKLNDWLVEHGHAGTVSDRTVRYWKTGKTRWPHTRQRAALCALFRRPIEDLGFIRPDAHPSRTTPEQDDVNRRTFMASTAAALTAPAVASRTMVGSSDVQTVRRELDRINALDDQRGGNQTLEEAALGAARRALGLQRSAAGQRVRSRLFALASDLTATAAWTALDSRQFGRAEQHLERALTLAGKGGDKATELRVWNSMSMLAYQRKNYADALAAGQAALRVGITRRDPMYASLAHARTAIGHAALGDRQAALRSLGYAGDALTKTASDEPRPSWIAFYGPAELQSLTAIAQDLLGRHAESEGASHQALAMLHPHFRRNRALVTARLALAQLHQGEIEAGCASAERVFTLMGDSPLPARMRSLIGDFHRDLFTTAPDVSTAKAWGDRYRTEWS
ncbi:XRE family transcriptional regulator [Streptomyces sp. NPDC101160]|uniref:XRE family transcriptional regulator n=1 Tax=Streptomyces sp. NPDC101160 TaxID=3366118 RepID=UPI0038108845